MSKHKYKKSEHFIEYYVSVNSKNITDVSIPIKKIKNIFTNLQNEFGTNNETIKEYSLYGYDNKELTVFPDGSSFCRQIELQKLEDKNLPSSFYILYKKKDKIPNDCFPSSFVYNTNFDITDIIYTFKEGVRIIISTYYNHNNKLEKIKKIEDLGKKQRSIPKDKVWCELYIQADCYSKTEDVYKAIEILQKSIE